MSTGAVWLILPTYDEAENIAAIVTAVRAELTQAAPDAFKILIVDDNSPDGTGQIADRLADRHDEVEVLHRTGRDGLAAAYLAGFQRALTEDAEYIFEMDSDFSHDPADLKRLLHAVRDDGAGLAIGSRYIAGGQIEGWGPLRRALSYGGSLYAQIILRLRIRDLTAGFKCFRAEILRAIELHTVRSHGYAFQVELTHRAVRAGFRVAEVPVTFRDRRHGRSKMTAKIAIEAICLVPRMRSGRWR